MVHSSAGWCRVMQDGAGLKNVASLVSPRWRSNTNPGRPFMPLMVLTARVTLRPSWSQTLKELGPGRDPHPAPAPTMMMIKSINQTCLCL